MNRNLTKFASIIVTTMLLSSIIAIFPASALPETRIYVDPPEVEGTALGQEFTIEIILGDVADLYGWEVKLSWDNTLLNCTAEEFPILPEGLNWEGMNNFPLGPGINQEEGVWYHGLSAMPMVEPFPIPFTGTIELVTLTFKVIQAPTTADLSCTLTLFDSKLSDSEANPIDHTLEHGFYIYYFVAAPGPWLEVGPDLPLIDGRHTWQARSVGEQKDIDIKINEVLLEHRLVGVEFKLRFDSALLEVVEEECKEGPFMKDPAWALNGTQFVGPIVEEDETGWFVLIAVLLIPNDGDTDKWIAFPEGSGVLATIRFEAISAEPDATVGCDLDLDDVKLANDKAEAVRARPAVHGRYEIRLVVFAGEVDIYTQWEIKDGTGGRGYHMPSEAFAPQGEVVLYANATYRGDGVSNKPVAFLVEDPNGTIVLQRTAITNGEGVAEVPFRIPTDTIPGKWKATATADIAGRVVEDYVEFEVGWLVEILSIEAEKKTYKKGDALEFTITYQSLMSFHDTDVTFAVVVYDDYEFTRVPIAGMTLSTSVGPGGAFSTSPGTGAETLNGLTIIPTWAFVGTARAYANAYEDGVAYCPEQYYEFEIVRA